MKLANPHTLTINRSTPRATYALIMSQDYDLVYRNKQYRDGESNVVALYSGIIQSTLYPDNNKIETS